MCLVSPHIWQGTDGKGGSFLCLKILPPPNTGGIYKVQPPIPNFSSHRQFTQRIAVLFEFSECNIRQPNCHLLDQSVWEVVWITNISASASIKVGPPALQTTHFPAARLIIRASKIETSNGKIMPAWILFWLSRLISQFSCIWPMSCFMSRFIAYVTCTGDRVEFLQLSCIFMGPRQVGKIFLPLWSVQVAPFIQSERHFERS